MSIKRQCACYLPLILWQWSMATFVRHYTVDINQQPRHLRYLESPAAGISYVAGKNKIRLLEKIDAVIHKNEDTVLFRLSV